MAMLVTDEVRKAVHDALMDAEAAVRNLRIAEDITKRCNTSSELKAYMMNARGYCANVRGYLAAYMSLEECERSS